MNSQNQHPPGRNAEIEPLYFRDGEIWWARLGVNIGYEMDGKNSNFARPVTVSMPLAPTDISTASPVFT